MTPPCRILPAQEGQKDALLALYRSMLGGPAGWDGHYPSMAHIEADLARGNLFVLTEGAGLGDGQDALVGAISIDEDADVAQLPNWSAALEPAGELARIAVRQDRRNRGLARMMMEHAFGELRRRGCKGVHILVRPGHSAALRSYARFGYRPAGHCLLNGKEYLCFERPL